LASMRGSLLPSLDVAVAHFAETIVGSQFEAVDASASERLLV
jgi:hypothetical protein